MAMMLGVAAHIYIFRDIEVSAKLADYCCDNASSK
jgi:hypothetical protein